MKDRGFDPDKKLGEKIGKMSRQELCALVSELCDRIRSDVGTGNYRGGVYPDNISLNEDGSVAIGPGVRCVFPGHAAVLRRHRREAAL